MSRDELAAPPSAETLRLAVLHSLAVWFRRRGVELRLLAAARPGDLVRGLARGDGCAKLVAIQFGAADAERLGRCLPGAAFTAAHTAGTTGELLALQGNKAALLGGARLVPAGAAGAKPMSGLEFANRVLRCELGWLRDRGAWWARGAAPDMRDGGEGAPFRHLALGLLLPTGEEGAPDWERAWTATHGWVRRPGPG